MKRLYIELICSLAAFALIVCACALFSHYTLWQVRSARELLRALPPPRDFEEAVTEEADKTALLETAEELKHQTKKAGKLLAFFMNYDLLNALDGSCSALCAALEGGEPAAYGAAYAALSEALSSIERIELPSLELLF